MACSWQHHLARHAHTTVRSIAFASRTFFLQCRTLQLEGDTLISGSRDCLIKVWVHETSLPRIVIPGSNTTQDLERGEDITKLEGHKHDIRYLECQGNTIGTFLLQLTEYRCSDDILLYASICRRMCQYAVSHFLIEKFSLECSCLIYASALGQETTKGPGPVGNQIRTRTSLSV